MSLHVLRTGPQTLIEDLGRPGYAAVGVGQSGVADRGAARRANALVGNPATAAVVEVLLGGLAVRAATELRVAVTGARCPLTVSGRPAALDTALTLAEGQTLELGIATAGMRAYLAVGGGIDVPPVLGSRSTDTLAGLGPEPVRPGDVLPVGIEPVGTEPLGTEPGGSGPAATNEPAAVDTAAALAAPASGRPAREAPASEDGVVTLHVVPGPRDNFLRRPFALTTGVWQVTPRGDRVGVVLDGEALERREGEIPSEGATRGAIQVPPNGRPVLFGPDHPLTGGYPVVAVVRDEDLDLTAQLRPGDLVSFVIAR